MKILFIGDIFAKPGRRVLKEYLEEVVPQKTYDLIIANVENAAGGQGFTVDIIKELFDYGVDVMTSGNHTWDKKEDAESVFKNFKNVIRPLNYPICDEYETPGSGSVIFEKNGISVGVINVQGRLFLHAIDCPFRSLKKEIERISKQCSFIIVDVHAETTSEKQALAWYVDGKVAAVLGTHTHVQTADERILPKGTAYISDVGMTGPYDSVIGMKTDRAIKRFLTAMKVHLEPAKKNAKLCGAILDIDEKTGKAQSIERIQWAQNL
ncbi:MAG: TIGR00282 family metallophosphoesterase [Deltaproteobacteria bacterium]|nr:TIGR00282 family metallophosphoesterase [Deltaproteobacteria bacterium]